MGLVNTCAPFRDFLGAAPSCSSLATAMPWPIFNVPPRATPAVPTYSIEQKFADLPRSPKHQRPRANSARVCHPGDWRHDHAVAQLERAIAKLDRANGTVDHPRW